MLSLALDSFSDMILYSILKTGIMYKRSKKKGNIPDMI
jgi:hypothetical protein